MDESGEAKSSSQKECVQVAVNIRPLIASELLLGCRDCITVVPGEPQVQIGAHCFTFDHVYGSSAIPSILIFEECVAPLIDAVFHGYNATVLAYGQTGSGKTYTMGTNFNGESNSGGIIPLVMNSIFKKAGEMKKDTKLIIRVSFIEIFKEEVFDLLNTHANAALRNDNNSSLAKPSRSPIQIRETVNGGITLAGVIEAEVTSKEEMELYLMRGSQSRATGSTNMNSQSSRSPAIFTICLEQKRYADRSRDGFVTNDFGDDILLAKLHLVDLAGSERAKRTGADGLRLKEGIHINKGLLALGNVINALGDEKKRKDGGHIPYRDSKLTRLLQDSLGGNSKTVMIACISPADANAEETINTLKYANRAKNIQNKAVINRDPASIEMQKLRSQLELLQSEVLFYRGNSAPFEELQVLRKRITLLEASNAELQASNAKLHQELKERQITCDHLSKYALDAQIPQKSIVLNNGRESCGESEADMDTSDSEGMLDMENVKSDEDWVESGNVTTKRRARGKKYNVEDENIVSEKDGYFCCSCSRNSTCITKKCECRQTSKSCSSHCGCNASKCANRADFFSNLDHKKIIKFASQLRSAFGEIGCCSLQQRKPLSDIGNAQVDPKASKPKKRKNWGKSTIQLGAEPIEPLAPQPNEVPAPFIDRSSLRNDESANKNKENSGAIVVPLRSDEKESRIL